MICSFGLGITYFSKFNETHAPHFRPITFAAVRYEYKYILPNFRLHELRSMLLPFISPDKFAAKLPGWQYTVRSIYFDTPTWEMYHTKRDHLAHRLKVRLRGYNLGDDTTSTFLEIKRKYEAPIKKNRMTLPFGAVKAIFAGAHADQFLPETEKADNVRRFFYQIHSKQLRPVVNVVYEREAYRSNIVDPDNDFRITLDKNLRSVPFPSVGELFVEREIQQALPGHFILEVKFNHYCPAWVKPILADLDAQKGPASKYVYCIDCQPTLRPERHGEGVFMSR